MSPRAWAIVTLIAVLAFVASPLLISGFNGFTAGQFPIPQDEPPVQPLGIAFSIWGVIYAWLVAGAGYGALRAADAPDWAAMRPWLVLSTGAGAFWLSLAQVSPPWATVLIAVMLATAVAAMLRSGRREMAWQALPVGLYAGWLTAATGLSLALLLAGFGWMGQVPAALVGIGFALVVAVPTHARRPDVWTYPVALIWALGWIVVRNIGAGGSGIVLGAAAVGIAAVLARMAMLRRA